MSFIEGRSGCQLKACWHDRGRAYPEFIVWTLPFTKRLQRARMKSL